MANSVQKVNMCNLLVSVSQHKILITHIPPRKFVWGRIYIPKHLELFLSPHVPILHFGELEFLFEKKLRKLQPNCT